MCAADFIEAHNNIKRRLPKDKIIEDGVHPHPGPKTAGSSSRRMKMKGAPDEDLTPIHI